MSTPTLLTVYCCLIICVSLAGGRLSSLLRMTHLRTQLLMSGVGGLMLGIAMLHLLPHAVNALGSASRAGIGALTGLIVMFLLVRLFHTHDHSVPAVDDSQACCSPTRESGAVDTQPQHHHQGCNHGPAHHHSYPPKGISWFGLFLGLLLHTLVDGIALASSVVAEADHGAWLGLGGLGTFLAVALHKPLDAFAITSVMNRQHWSVQSQWVANVAFSLACPLGALAFYFGVSGLSNYMPLLGLGLAISAGFFIGIALADLLPEVAFHDHDRGKLTSTFLLGVAIAFAVENLPGHSHDHGPAGSGLKPTNQGHQHPSNQVGHEEHEHEHEHEHEDRQHGFNMHVCSSLDQYERDCPSF